MVEMYSVGSKFYVDEAIDTALREGKTFRGMEEWAVKRIKAGDLRAYFFERAGKVLVY